MDGVGLEMSEKKKFKRGKKKINREHINARFRNSCFKKFCAENSKHSTVFDASDRNDRIRTIQTNTANH